MDKCWILEDCPEEMVVHILSFVPMLDYFRTLPFVCKTFLRFARDRVYIRERLRVLGYDSIKRCEELVHFHTQRWYYLRYGRCLDLVRAFLSYDTLKSSQTSYPSFVLSPTKDIVAGKRVTAAVGKLLFKAIMNYYRVPGVIRQIDRAFLNVLSEIGVVDVPDCDALTSLTAAPFTVPNVQALVRLFGAIFPLRNDWILHELQQCIKDHQKTMPFTPSHWICTVVQRCFNEVCVAISPDNAVLVFPRMAKKNGLLYRQPHASREVPSETKTSCDNITTCITRLLALIRDVHHQVVYLSPIFIQYFDQNLYTQNRSCIKQRNTQDTPAILFHSDMLVPVPVAHMYENQTKISFTVQNMVLEMKLPQMIPLEQLRLVGYWKFSHDSVYLTAILDENQTCTATVYPNGKCMITGVRTHEEACTAVADVMKQLAHLMKETDQCL